MVEMTRNRQHPAQRQRPKPGAAGRDRARHQHLRRPGAGLGHGRASGDRIRPSPCSPPTTSSSPRSRRAAATAQRAPRRHRTPGQHRLSTQRSSPDPPARATAFRSPGWPACPDRCWQRTGTSAGSWNRPRRTGNPHQDLICSPGIPGAIRLASAAAKHSWTKLDPDP